MRSRIPRYAYAFCSVDDDSLGRVDPPNVAIVLARLSCRRMDPASATILASGRLHHILRARPMLLVAMPLVAQYKRSRAILSVATGRIELRREIYDDGGALDASEVLGADPVFPAAVVAVASAGAGMWAAA